MAYFVYWMTGLSGAGKSTIATKVQQWHPAEILDGDVLRQGISKDLKFSREDRKENLRRAAHLAKHLLKYTDVIVAMITPYEEVRQMVRDIIGPDRFFLIWIKASFETCSQRDPKGLYKKSLRGLIKNFTGKDDLFEEPTFANLVIDTEKQTPDESAKEFLQFIQKTKKAYML